jgi:hypothetical protein
MRKRLLYSVVGLAVAGCIVAASFFHFRPRATRLAVTARAGDDTVVVNQMRPMQLRPLVLDQYGRRFPSDSAVRYGWISGDSLSLASDGVVRCSARRDAMVRATLGRLVREFTLRCRPVASIESVSWVDLLVGDSARDLSFVAHGPDGRAETELRGAISIGDASVVSAKGTSIRGTRPGQTFAAIEIGNARKVVPIVVYQPVKSFTEVDAKRVTMTAMRVSLGRGDTIETPLPKAAFWVTYYSKDPTAAPPTIELFGKGSCTTGNGISARRIEMGQYAKYCTSGTGTRMIIAHGMDGAPTVTGTVALRVMW